MKKPGDQLVTEPTELRLVHHPDKNEMLPYERLLGEAMEGDTSMFAREDSVDAAWAIVEPDPRRRDARARVRARKLGPGRRRSPDRGGGRLARDDRMSAPPGVVAAAEAAVALIDDGARVGLGSGRAAAAFVERLAARARAGLSVECVATSEAAARQARAAGLRLIELAEGTQLDITVDGADEVAPNLNLVKGRGGAFVRERIVAASSRRQVIVVGPEKLVEALGETGPIPVEIIPMALGLCTRRLKDLGVRPALRADARKRAAVRQRQRQSDRRRHAGGDVAERRGRARVRRGAASRSRASSTPDCSSQPRSACWSVTRTGASTRAGRSIKVASWRTYPIC